MKAVEILLARASWASRVAPGDVVIANVDRVVLHDQMTYMTSNVHETQGPGTVRHPDRVWSVSDHNFAPATLRQAEVVEQNRNWVRKHGLHLADCGSGQVHNVGSRITGLGPGMVVVGDSHSSVHGTIGAFGVAVGNNSIAGTVLPYGKTWFRVPETILVELVGRTEPGTTARDVALWLAASIGEGKARYKAIEFRGGYIDALGFWDRWLFPLLGADIGAKSCFIWPDEITRARVEEMGLPWLDADDPLLSPADRSEYEEIWTYDVSSVVPQVACPPTVGNLRDANELDGVPVQWAELGGHGGGRLEDIRMLAAVLSRYPKHPDVKVNVVPDSRETFERALDEGLVASLFAAGATWFPPSTGSNQAVNMGAMTDRESMISTQSRNFPGRNGGADAAMYLASALTVAASATTGAITDPRTLDSRLIAAFA